MVEEIVLEVSMVLNLIEAPPVDDINPDKPKQPVSLEQSYVIMPDGTRILLRDAVPGGDDGVRLASGVYDLKELVRSQ